MILYTLLTVFSSKKEKKISFSPDEIKNLRQSLGLTQNEFASKFSVSQSLVAYWETGKKSPTLSFLAKFSQFAGEISTPEKQEVPAQSRCHAQARPSAKKIKALRETLGLTQAEFAKRLGTSRRLVIYWETGKRIPSLKFQTKLKQLANSVNQPKGEQIMTSEEGEQIMTSEEGEQIMTSEEGEQIMTSEEGEQIMTSEEGEQNVTDEEQEQNVTSEEGEQAENFSRQGNCKEAALEYLSFGWSVIPLCPPDCSPDKVPWHWRDKDGKPSHCAHPGKVPLVAWTVYQERLPTESEVEQWFSKWPFANVGIVTGRVSKLLVVDFDSYEAIDAIKKLGGFPKTPEVQTGGGGQHNYFQHPYVACDRTRQEGIIKNFAGKLKSVHPDLEKVDFRADGGQVVAPPSLHVSGNRYVWTVAPRGRPRNAWHRDEVKPPSLPKWFFDLLEHPPNPPFVVKKSPLNPPFIKGGKGGLPENFLVLKKCDSLIKSLWSKPSDKVSQKGGPERSNYDWALGQAIIERGIRNRDDLTTILAHFPHGKYARDSSETNLALTVEKLISTVPHLSKENAEEVLLSLRKQLNTIIPELNEREVLVVRATPGLGKTTEIIEVIRNSERKVILAEPTKEMARTVFEQFSDDTALLKGRDKENCMRYSQVQAIAAKGYMPGKVICPGCPYSPDKLFSSCCEYFRQFFNPTRVKVTTYEQALELHFAGKLNADLLVLDEDPSRALFKKVEITANQLHFPEGAKYPLPTFGRLIRDTLHEAEEKAAGQTQAFRCREIVSLLNSVAKKRRIKLTKHLRLVSSCIENVFDQPARLESFTEEEMEALPHAYVGFLASSLLDEIEFAARKDSHAMSPRKASGDGVTLESHGDEVARLANGKASAPHEVSPVRSIAWRGAIDAKASKPSALGDACVLHWNSRLTLVVSGGRARFLLREVRGIPVRTPIVVLDAYANKDYYSKLLGRDVKFLMFDAQSHCEVMTIPLNTSKNAFQKRKENLFDDLAAVVYRYSNPVRDRRDQPRDGAQQRETNSGQVSNGANRKVLVYTYLFLKEDVENMFPFVAVEHFWSGRGKDCWRDYDVVIIFGTPEPNPSELFDDARALYADDEKPISLAQSESDPRKYADSRLQLLREMKREDEIMQDVHRIRPIWGKGLDKKVVVLSQLYCPQLPPDRIIDPQTLDKKSAQRELRKERLSQLIEACIKEYGFYFDSFAVAAGFIKTTGGDVCMHGFDGVRECMDTGFLGLCYGVGVDDGGVGERMDTGFWQPSNKYILIRELPETSNDAGSARRIIGSDITACYGGSNKEYIANRDAILAKLGLSPARMSVHQDGVWRPYKIWGDKNKASAFFARSEAEGRSGSSEVERQQEEEEKARREYEEEVRRELDEEFSRYEDTLDYEEGQR